MGSALDPRIDAAVTAALADAVELVPFARAVIQHLSGPAAAGDAAEVAGRVLRALEAAREPGEGDVLAGMADPALLASFFQNADLLDPSSERTHRIASGVMAALERIGATS